MPSSHPPPTVEFISPSGQAVHDFHISPTGQISYTRSSSTADPQLSQLFHDALSIRTAVFVLEQHCSAAEEIDVDDGISWHWILYADNEDEEGEERSGSEKANTIGSEDDHTAGAKRPAATIRLVPAQAHADADDEKAVEGPDYKGSKVWDHNEPYVKIGRLATVAPCRGRGYGKILVNTALGFAGRNGGKMVRDTGLGEWKGLLLAHAQKSVESWYKSLGFELDEGMGRWWEEGIEHVAMWKRVEVLGA